MFNRNDLILEIKLKESFSNINTWKIKPSELKRLSEIIYTLEQFGFPMIKATGFMIKEEEKERSMFID